MLSAPQPGPAVHQRGVHTRIVEHAVVAGKERRKTQHGGVELDHVEGLGLFVAYGIRGLSCAKADHQRPAGLVVQQHGQPAHPRHVMGARCLGRGLESVDDQDTIVVALFDDRHGGVRAFGEGEHAMAPLGALALHAQAPDARFARNGDQQAQGARRGQDHAPAAAHPGQGDREQSQACRPGCAGKPEPGQEKPGGAQRAHDGACRVDRVQASLRRRTGLLVK